MSYAMDCSESTHLDGLIVTGFPAILFKGILDLCMNCCFKTICVCKLWLLCDSGGFKKTESW